MNKKVGRRFGMRPILAAGAGVALLVMSGAVQAAAQDKSQLEAQLFNAKMASALALLDARRRLTTGEAPGASPAPDVAWLQMALKDAQLRFESGARVQGQRELDEGYDALKRLVMQSVSSDPGARADSVNGAPRVRAGADAGFQHLSGTVRSLDAAYRRIVAEADPPPAPGAPPPYQGLLTKAEQVHAAGRVDEASVVLQRAYLLIKESIHKVREGQTLVRALYFATPQEEYDYELQRNDAHLMLLEVLGAKEGVPSSVLQSGRERSDALRLQAREQAGAGDYRQAIDTLEQATEALIRVLRIVGVPIPG